MTLQVCTYFALIKTDIFLSAWMVCKYTLVYTMLQFIKRIQRPTYIHRSRLVVLIHYSSI